MVRDIPRLGLITAALAMAIGVGCSAPSEIVVVVGVAESPAGWTDRVRITIDDLAPLETPLDEVALPLSLGVSSDGAAELHAVAEALLDGAVVARQEGRMRFLPGRRLLLHLYLSPTCASASCGEDQSCHLDGCIGVDREPCAFVTLPDNGSDIGCTSPVGMDAGDDAGRDGGLDAELPDTGPGEDGGPLSCVLDTDCDDGDPCTVGTCPAGVCVFERARNGADCSDGEYCNGAETCGPFGCRGTAVVCPASQVCDEALDTCVECVDDMDCQLAPITGLCSFADACTTAGTQRTTIAYGTCRTGGTCDRTTISDSTDTTVACTRASTDGALCLSTSDTHRCCSEVCVDTAADLTNCGGCGLACASGEGCGPVTWSGGRPSGQCSCSPSTGSLCPSSQACLNTGRCGCDGSASACAPGQSCVLGVPPQLCVY